MPTANRHLGISFVDLLEQEATEETINIRAFTDATVMSAHSNMVVDPDQIEIEDAENRTPDSLIRRKRQAQAKAGVPAIVFTKNPGPDASILTAVQSFQTTATSMTGVGANFQGAAMDEISDMRVSTETAKIVDNNSSLMLNYFARNFADHLCKILVKLLNTAVNHGASPQLLEIKDSWKEAMPGTNIRPRTDFVLNADIGVNDAQEKSNKAQAVMSLIAAATGGGGADEQGNPIPQIPVELTPVAGYEAMKLSLEAQGIMNPDMYIQNPNVQPDEVQQATLQKFMSDISQAVPQMVQQAVSQMIEESKQLPESQLKLAQAAKTAKETEILDASVDEKVMIVATELEAEERREEEAVYEAAIAKDKQEADEELKREDLRLKEKELELQRETAAKSETTTTTSVVNP